MEKLLRMINTRSTVKESQPLSMFCKQPGLSSQLAALSVEKLLRMINTPSFFSVKETQPPSTFCKQPSLSSQLAALLQ